MLTMLAFAGGIPQLLIWAIVVAGCIGIAVIVARVAGIPIPGWFWQILGIILLVVVGVLAIKFLAGLL